MKVWWVIREVLREIFEESAYARFCAREGLARGRESYAMFVRGRRVKEKCC